MQILRLFSFFLFVSFFPTVPFLGLNQSNTQAKSVAMCPELWSVRTCAQSFGAFTHVRKMLSHTSEFALRAERDQSVKNTL